MACGDVTFASLSREEAFASTGPVDPDQEQEDGDDFAEFLVTRVELVDEPVEFVDVSFADKLSLVTVVFMQLLLQPLILLDLLLLVSSLDEHEEEQENELEMNVWEEDEEDKDPLTPLISDESQVDEYEREFDDLVDDLVEMLGDEEIGEEEQEDGLFGLTELAPL